MRPRANRRLHGDHLDAVAGDARQQARQMRGPQGARRTQPAGRGAGQAPTPASPKTGERMSLRRISAELKAAGYLNEHGREFNPNSIKSMVERPHLKATFAN